MNNFNWWFRSNALIWHYTWKCFSITYYGLDFYLPLSCACIVVCALACVWGWACVSVFCMPVLYAVCWMGVDVVFFVLLFHVIYSRTIASIANVYCWLYPTLNKVYLNLSYLILSYLSTYRCSAPELSSHGACKCPSLSVAWWRNQMETLSALLVRCVGNSPVTGEFPSQRPVTRNFDVFFDLCMNKWLSKQSWGWWFETPLCPLWRQCNGALGNQKTYTVKITLLINALKCWVLKVRFTTYIVFKYYLQLV